MSEEQRKILIFSAHESERGLIEPINTELNRHPHILATVCGVPSWDACNFKNRADEFTFYSDVMLGVNQALSDFAPDIVLIPTDRYEMVLTSLVVFRRNIPIAHFHAGDIGRGTHDDIYRHIISLMANIHFCQGEWEKNNLKQLGVEEKRIHIVGSTAFDHVLPQEHSIPEHPYVLVLWHPLPTSETKTVDDLKRLDWTVHKILDDFPSIQVYILPPNNEEYADLVLLGTRVLAEHERVHLLERMRRPEYLGWLKNATLFISNSSSGVYEAPVLNTKVLNWSERNRDRHQPKYEEGASHRISNLLANYDLTDRLVQVGLAPQVEAIETMPETPVVLDGEEELPPPIPIETAGRWYRRGDIGKYHWIQDSGVSICGKIDLNFDRISPDQPFPQLVQKALDNPDACKRCVKLLKMRN